MGMPFLRTRRFMRKRRMELDEKRSEEKFGEFGFGPLALQS